MTGKKCQNMYHCVDLERAIIHAGKTLPALFYYRFSHDSLGMAFSARWPRAMILPFVRLWHRIFSMEESGTIFLPMILAGRELAWKL